MGTMKALVLSGGSGTRLRPITHTSAKQLVPVGNKPVLFYGLEAIAEAGITEVGIVVGETEAEIRRAVGDGSRFGLRVTYLRQEAPLGLAHGVLIARDFLGDEDFLLFLGDNFIVGGIADIVAGFRASPADALLLLTEVPDPGRFGVAELGPDGRIVGIEEKPQRPKSDLALVGVYLFGPAIHRAVRAIAPSARGELEISDAVQWLLDAGLDVRSTVITGYWKDTGNVDDMLEANRTVLEGLEHGVEGEVDGDTEIIGRVRIASGAIVKGTRIVGPAIIGTGARIVDSYIGPFTSIGDGVRVEDSEIEYSIVLDGSTIQGVRPIEASLVGRAVEVTPAARTRAAHRLVLGDYSRVRIA
jgi:glucose-1-phosphate thymidylyltransferase